MKKFSVLLAVFCLNQLHSDTGEEFLATYRSVIEQKDKAKMLSLYYTDGCSESDKKMLEAIVGFHFSDGKITEVKFEPTPAGTTLVKIANAKNTSRLILQLAKLKLIMLPSRGME
jgi:hypothetical protein